MNSRTYEVVWAPSADADLERIHAWLFARSPAAFRDLTRRLVEATDRLAELPELGTLERSVPGSYHFLVVPPYKVYYRATNASVRILRIWDTRRDPADLQLPSEPASVDVPTAERSDPTSGTD